MIVRTIAEPSEEEAGVALSLQGNPRASSLPGCNLGESELASGLLSIVVTHRPWGVALGLTPERNF